MRSASAGRVSVLTKADASESNTGYAQGGIAAAVGDDDSPELHAADTIRAGDGLCDEVAVRVLVEEGPGYVRELLEWGARFDRDADRTPGARTGSGAQRPARAACRRRDRARDRPRALGSASAVCRRSRPFITRWSPSCSSKTARSREWRSSIDPVKRQELRAGATLLATGGAGQVFSETTNPAVATGDGISLAYHAGARVADLEFIQFHPTALNLTGAPRFLISEALRGEGARLVNSRGDAFMTRYHPGGDLAPRDVVARSIVREEERDGGPRFSDARASRRGLRSTAVSDDCGDVRQRRARSRARSAFRSARRRTTSWAASTRTSGAARRLPGLFAAGEVACTGVHGANRLASNSLLEGLVFGARAGAAMQQPRRAAALKSDRRLAAVADVPDPRCQSLAPSPQPRPLSPQPLLDVRDPDVAICGPVQNARRVGGCRPAARIRPQAPPSAPGSSADADSWRRFIWSPSGA